MTHYFLIILSGLLYLSFGKATSIVIDGHCDTYMQREHVVKNKSVITYLQKNHSALRFNVILLWPFYFLTLTILSFIFKIYLNSTRHHMDRRLLSIANEDL